MTRSMPQQQTPLGFRIGLFRAWSPCWKLAIERSSEPS